MSVMTDIVRNVVIIAVLTAFWEMLLPEGKMQAFVRAVLGLILVAAVINPIAGALSQPVAKVTYHIDGQNETKSLLAAAETMNDKWTEAGNDAYIQGIEQQVKSMVLLADDVRDAEITAIVDREQTLTGLDIALQVEDDADFTAVADKLKQVLSGLYATEQIEIYKKQTKEVIVIE